jgi:hypothetical protein
VCKSATHRHSRILQSSFSFRILTWVVSHESLRNGDASGKWLAALLAACEFRLRRNIVAPFKQLASGRIESRGLFGRSSDAGEPHESSRAETQSRRGKRNLKPAIQIGTICCWNQGPNQYQSRLGLAVLCASASLRENAFQSSIRSLRATKLREPRADLDLRPARIVATRSAGFRYGLCPLPHPTPLLIANPIEPNSRIVVATVTSHSGRLMRNIGSPMRRIAPKNNTKYGTRTS